MADIYLPSNVQMDKMNNFKLMEKKYRFYEGRKTDFSEVINFNDPKVDLAKHNITALSLQGKQAYKLGFPSGVYIIKEALSIEKQFEVVTECMNTFVKRPYRTNLFIYEEDADWKTTYNPTKKPKIEETIASLAATTTDGKDHDTAKLSGEKMTEMEATTAGKEESKEAHVEGSIPIDSSAVSSTSSHAHSVDTSFSSAHGTSSKDYNKDKFIINDFNKFNFNKKVRWSNVGAQYDWDNRKYPSFTTPIPKIINELSEIARGLCKEEVPDIDDYDAEAVIVNYYDKKNYMSGHLDDGESDQKSPIFSFTFGSSCVFLMGDRTKDFTPLPIQLDAGDLMVMSGYSRNCYHGVPRILGGSFQKEKFIAFAKEKYPEIFENAYIQKNKLIKNFENDLRHAINYLCESRINLNFRQVERKVKKEEDSVKGEEIMEKEINEEKKSEDPIN